VTESGLMTADRPYFGKLRAASPAHVIPMLNQKADARNGHDDMTRCFLLKKGSKLLEAGEVVLGSKMWSEAAGTGGPRGGQCAGAGPHSSLPGSRPTDSPSSMMPLKLQRQSRA
jgi:hypothetical protein